jgi:hypothetical protein
MVSYVLVIFLGIFFSLFRQKGWEFLGNFFVSSLKLIIFFLSFFLNIVKLQRKKKIPPIYYTCIYLPNLSIKEGLFCFVCHIEIPQTSLPLDDVLLVSLESPQ